MLLLTQLLYNLPLIIKDTTLQSGTEIVVLTVGAIVDIMIKKLRIRFPVGHGYVMTLASCWHLRAPVKQYNLVPAKAG